MPSAPTDKPSAPLKARHSIGRRAVLGLAIMTVVTAGAATLLHGSIEPGIDVPTDPDATQRRALLAGVASWSRVADLAMAETDASALLVLNGASVTALRQSATQKAVAGLQTRADGGRRPVLAAISLAAISPAASMANDVGTHGLVDDALARNFDGIFLECGPALAAANQRGGDAREQLMAVVAQIGERARLVNPQFLLILENAAELAADIRVHRLIDGVAKDNLLFGQDAPGADNNRTDIIAGLHDLNRVRKSGRPVFVTEYLPVDAADTRAGARQTLAALGFIGRFAPARDTN